MLKPIAEFIVKIADLVEAEGRSLRGAVSRLGLSLAFSCVAAALALGGLAMLLWALHMVLAAQLGPVWAKTVVGLVGLICAGVLLWIASRQVK